MRSVLLVLLFMAVAVFSIASVVTLVLPVIPHLVGVSAGESVSVWQLLAIIGAAVLLVFGALYAGGLAWLVLACRIFTRDEIEQVLRAGPNTRLEVWVLDRFSR